jgi:hypothetical protein
VPKAIRPDPGAPGTALAFGRIKSDGTVDVANSKNVAVAATLPTGVYCLVVPPGSRNIIAQVELGAPAVATASVQPGDALIMCPPGPSNAVVALSTSAGGIAMRDFMVLVNLLGRVVAMRLRELPRADALSAT